MHAKLALLAGFAGSNLASAAFAPDAANVVEREVRPRQTTNPGGPIQSLSGSSSVTDEGTTGVLSIQTDTSIVLSIQTDTVVGGGSTASPSPSGTDSSSSTTETSAAASSSVSDAGAAQPRETGFALAAAAAAAGFIGAVAAF
ncbi:hypothetical protein F4677DRAFT_406932 [Hypoxylon crocopeplum]|nr:hypothetical protein F4677DRAFT_406932 [Hypoxylon crocopeplum]